MEYGAIKRLSEYSPAKMSVDLLEVYDKLIWDERENLGQGKKVVIKKILTAVELCNLIENMYFDMCIGSLLPACNRRRIPDLRDIKSIPMEMRDLRIYFERRVTQMLSYIVQENKCCQEIEKPTKEQL